MMDKPFQLPGLHVYEYLLVIDIPAALRERIEEQRAVLAEKYNIIQPQVGRPNVSLARFSAVKMKEERIIQRLQAIAQDEKPFVIDLQDFGSYPMHAIFIKIANQQRVLQLIKKLKQARRIMKTEKEDPYFLQDPNIVLAGRIQKENYIEAIKEYPHKKFSGRFLVNSFLLLKRAGDEKKYTLVKRFDFQSLPVSAGQGVLFN
jgi:2'-5' RNA ligase